MLDPQAKALLESIAASGRPTFDTLSVPAARQAYREARMPLQPPPAEVASVDAARMLVVRGLKKLAEVLDASRS